MNISLNIVQSFKKKLMISINSSNIQNIKLGIAISEINTEVYLRKYSSINVTFSYNFENHHYLYIFHIIYIYRFQI